MRQRESIEERNEKDTDTQKCRHTYIDRDIEKDKDTDMYRNTEKDISEENIELQTNIL